jgi:hypothetical protein
LLAVLGEFGSGKSLHSYSLGIETAKMFLRDPIRSRIPIRLALKNCMDSNLQEVLEEQLYNMDTSYEEFSRLNPTLCPGLRLEKEPPSAGIIHNAQLLNRD